MRLTRKYGEGCNDSTCPALFDTDDPELVGVQGSVLTDPEALADLGPIPGHEQVVLLPRELLMGYANKETERGDNPTSTDRQPAGADLPACFDLFEQTAVRAETLRAYNVPAEAEALMAYEKGWPLPERSARVNPWLARIRDTTRAGQAWSRYRLIGWPLSPYERFQLHYGYPPSAKAGEKIWVTDRSAHDGLGRHRGLLGLRSRHRSAVRGADVLRRDWRLPRGRGDGQP